MTLSLESILSVGLVDAVRFHLLQVYRTPIRLRITVRDQVAARVATLREQSLDETIAPHLVTICNARAAKPEMRGHSRKFPWATSR